MRFFPPNRGIALLFMTIPLLLFLSTSCSNGEHSSDPIISSQLSLEPTGSPDADPAVFNCTIPWGSGEPSITNVSYRTCSKNWTGLGNWSIFHDGSSNRSIISFSIELEWGCMEEVKVLITDMLGSNSTIGTTIICSRKPSVRVQHLLDDGEEPTEGINRFRIFAEDPDGQELDIIWYVDGQAVISEGDLEVHLLRGDHVISAGVTDGQWTVLEEMNVTVHASPVRIERGGFDLMKVSSIVSLVFSALCWLCFGIFIFISYIRERSTPEDDDEEYGSAVDPEVLTCEICMNELKEGLGRIKCRCGALMHRGCGRREGVCPKCGRELLI
ncbi:MAG: hypothetical protein ACMUHM_08910 [Thermoplasmatota archaeon]